MMIIIMVIITIIIIININILRTGPGGFQGGPLKYTCKD